MVMVIEGGADLAAETYMHRLPVETRRFIADRHVNLTPLLNTAGLEFMARTEEVRRNYLAATESSRLLIASQRQVETMWRENIVQDLFSMAQFQNAPPCMIDYLMADPVIRNAYHRNQCEGFGDRYVDNEPGRVGAMHSTYRLVTDGMVMYQDDDDEETWESTTWSIEDEQQLTFDAKSKINFSMRNLRALYLEGKEDPTSESNASLS